MKKTKLQAFTLIELLVVVAIIAILSGLSFAGYQSVVKKGQDTKRLGDLSQIRLALETYKSINNVYPDAGSGTEYVQGLAPGFIDKLPQDPTGASGAIADLGFVAATDCSTAAIARFDRSTGAIACRATCDAAGLAVGEDAVAARGVAADAVDAEVALTFAGFAAGGAVGLGGKGGEEMI